MKKINVVIPSIYDPRCPTIRSRLYPLCLLLAQRGFEFTFLVIGRKTEEISPGITYRGYKNYGELIRIVAALKKKDTDIILACKSYSITGLLSFWVARLRGLGYVLDVDDRIFPSEINKWWRFPLYIQEWLSDRFLMHMKPPTIVASRALETYYGNHTVYIPNSADMEFFSKRNWSTEIIKERFRIDGLVVIWPAVFFQEIDREYILEIFRIIQQKTNNISLLVLGEGEYLPRIKTQVKKMRLSNVIFGGAIDYRDMPHFYASADAGILPLRDNHYDACKGPIKLYEYMAMELPIITTPVGEPRYMVEKANCGIIIPFNDAGKAADSIIELLRSKERLKQMGGNGRNYLTQFQSLDQQAAKMENVLLSVIKDNWSKGKCL